MPSPRGFTLHFKIQSFLNHRPQRKYLCKIKGSFSLIRASNLKFCHLLFLIRTNNPKLSKKLFFLIRANNLKFCHLLFLIRTNNPKLGKKLFFLIRANNLKLCHLLFLIRTNNPKLSKKLSLDLTPKLNTHSISLIWSVVESLLIANRRKSFQNFAHNILFAPGFIAGQQVFTV